MNALFRLTPPVVHDVASARATCAVLADRAIGSAMDRLADCMAATYEPRRSLTQGQATAAQELRLALADLARARNLLEGLMSERVS
jgi:hypothetical protein